MSSATQTTYSLLSRHVPDLVRFRTSTETYNKFNFKNYIEVSKFTIQLITKLNRLKKVSTRV